MGSTTSYDRLKVKANIGEKVNDWKPASEALEEKDPGYYGVMELVDWYTQAPEENEDGSFKFNPEAKVTDDTLVKKGMKLYAKTKVREGQKIAISLSAYTLGETITEWNSKTSMTAGTRHFLDPSTKTGITYNEENEENKKKSFTELPLGVSLTKDDLKELLGEWTINGKKYTFNNWCIGGQTLEVGTVINPEKKIYSHNGTEYAPVEVYPQMDWPITISFVTKTDGESLPDIILTVKTNDGYVPASTNTMTDAQKAQVAAVNTWVQQQEKKDGFNQIFRGWYPNERYTGEPFRDGAGYSISGMPSGFDPSAGTRYLNTPFPAPMTLYAKWENRCKVTFNLKGETLSNADKFADYYVAVNEKLTKPSVEPRSTDYPKRVFLGWYEDKDCNTPWDFENKTVTTDVTLYAKWTSVKEVTLKFVYYAPDDLTNETQLEKQTIKVPLQEGRALGAENVPELPGTRTESGWNEDTMSPFVSYQTMGTKRGLIYTGWSYYGDFGWTPLTKGTELYGEVKDGATVTVLAQSNIYLQFTYDPQGGSINGSTDATTVTSDSQKIVGTSPVPTKYKDNNDEIKFLGWYTEPDGKGEKLDRTKKYSLNTRFYAAWEKEKECTLIFDIGNYPGATVVLKKGDAECSGTTADDKVTYTKLPRGTYHYFITLSGYKPLTGTYEITDATSDEPYTIEVKDWPVFVPVTEIKLAIPDNQIMQRKSYDLSKLATVEPENASYKNITWSVSGNGVTLGKDGTLTVSDTAAGTVTLTATITNGKLNENGTTEVDYTKPFTLTIVPYQPTISFNAGTGPAASDIKNMPEPVLATDGKISEPSPAPTASGWTFDGWYKNEACGDDQLWNFEKDTAQEDRTLYAKWTKNPVAVTITFAGGEGAVLNPGATGKHEGKSGDKITRPACMYTKPGYIFRSWDGTFAGTEYTLPEEAKTFTAQWTQITSAIVADDINHALDGISADNAKDYKPQLLAARDALAAGTATKTDATLIAKLSRLFADAGLGPVSIDGDAKDGVEQVGAILSADEGKAVVLTVNKLATAGKTLPEAYQNDEYKSAWYTVSMKVGGATTEPKVPVILTMPIPADLSKMAADTIRVLLYKNGATQPVIMTPTLKDSGKLTFAFDGNGQIAFVGKAISDTADTRVTGLTMEYNGTKMGNVTQDKDGNFTVVLPASLNQSAIDLLASGKWKTYLTVAPQAKVATAESKDGFDATYWAETGVALTYSLTKANDYSDSRTLTAIAKNGTTRNFTVTVKKITDADRTYKIAVANISGGTVTATPSPAAAGEEVKLTVTPNDGKKLVAGSLSYCLQSAGAKSVPIDESSLTFIMPAGDININAQFEDDANAPLKNPPQITAFVVNGVSAVINSDTKAITIILPYGTDLKHVAPTIVTANASKVEPSSAQRVDLSTPKAYRVYASNGAYVTYTVTAYTEEPSPTQSLWEKLQNQINSNPNWWELAEYQKKTGYYK